MSKVIVDKIVNHDNVEIGSVILDNITTMFALDIVDKQTTVMVKGYEAINDGGGGLFNYDSTIDKSTANGGNIFDPSQSLETQGAGTGTGCWIRQDKEDGMVQYGKGTNYPNFLNLISELYCWGDSLTEGSGGTAYPTQLEARTSFNITNKGFGGESATQIKDRFLADTNTKNYTVIIWVGSNNVADAQLTIDEVQAMVDDLGHNRYLVFNPLNGTDGITEGNKYPIIQAISKGLKEAHQINYFDVRSYLVNNGLADLGITPTSQDILDTANDVIPTSLRSDDVHLNTDGYSVVASRAESKLRDILEKQDRKKAMSVVMDAWAGLGEMEMGRAKRIPSIDAVNLSSVGLKMYQFDQVNYGNMKISGDFQSFQFDKHLIPYIHAGGNLGQDSLRWANGYFSGDLHTNNLKAGQIFVGADEILIKIGTGNPEGAITAKVGSLWLKTTEGGSTLYVKETGTGNTGWVGK